MWRRRLIPTKIFHHYHLAILSAFILIERSLGLPLKPWPRLRPVSAVQAINTAVLEKVATSNVRYADLVQLEKDINNRVSLCKSI